MMVMLAGGPRNGEIMEIQDAVRTVYVPVMGADGFEKHVYEVVQFFSSFGGRKIAGARYAGIQGGGELFTPVERTNDGQQKQARTSREDPGFGNDHGEPGREVSRPGPESRGRKSEPVTGDNVRRPKCRRDRDSAGRDHAQPKPDDQTSS